MATVAELLESFNVEIKDPYSDFTFSKRYAFWKNALLSKMINMFIYDGLSVPSEQLEMRNLLEGFSGIVREKGKLWAVSGGLNGVTPYHNVFTNLTYSAPSLQGGSVKIGNDCVICKNDSMRSGMSGLIDLYATFFAHADVSIVCAMINTRYTEVFSCTDEAEMKNVQEFYAGIANGKPRALLTDSFANTITNLADNKKENGTLKDLIECRSNLMKNFFAEIGVKSAYEKKERMNTSEVSADSQLLMFNISDMFNCRKLFCKEMKETFGEKITVNLSPEYSIITQETENEKGGDIDAG